MTETQTEKIPRKKRIKNADEIAIEQRFYAEIGSRIKKMREDAGLTQKAIADVLGTRTSFIALIEGGQRVPMYQVQRILEVIGHTIDFAEKKNTVHAELDKAKLEELGEALRAIEDAPPLYIKETNTNGNASKIVQIKTLLHSGALLAARRS